MRRLEGVHIHVGDMTRILKINSYEAGWCCCSSHLSLFTPKKQVVFCLVFIGKASQGYLAYTKILVGFKLMKKYNFISFVGSFVKKSRLTHVREDQVYDKKNKNIRL